MSRVVLHNLPYAIRGFSTVDSDGEQLIVINARHSKGMNQSTYTHEISHCDDFGFNNIDIDKLELLRHH